MNRILYILFIIIPLLSHAQKDTIAHLYTFGSVANDLAEDIAATSDGGLILVGSTASSGDGNTDIYLLKIDSTCNKEWSWALGGLNNDWGYSVIETYDKGFLIAASTNSYGNGGYDAMLLKRDSFGNFEWQKTYGGVDWDFAFDVVQTFDSGFVFCGETYNNTSGFSDVFVVKTNVLGDTMWTKTVGGSMEDRANAVIQTSDSNIVVVGYKNTVSDSTQAYLLKFNRDGDLLWDSTYGWSNYEIAKDVVEALDGNYVLAGTTTTTGLDKDYYVVKTTTNGAKIWEQVYAGVKDEESNAIAQIDNGDFWVVGYTEANGGGKRDAKMFRINPGGWWAGQNSTFGSLENEDATGFAYGLNGAMYLSGYSDSYGEGLKDLMVIRVDTVVSQQQFSVLENIDVAAIGVKETLNNSLSLSKIFPNPAQSIITIDVTQIPQRIQVVDLLGNVLLSQELKSFSTKIDLGSISSGVYLLNLSNNLGVTYVEKLVIID